MDDDAGPQASMERPQASIESLTATFQDLFDKQGTPISQTLGGSAATATDDGAHLRSSIMDEDAGPQSLFLLVSWNYLSPYYSSIIKLETQVHNDKIPSWDDAPVFQTEFSAHIPRLPQLHLSWAFSPPPASSPEDLYLLPNWSLNKDGIEVRNKSPGFIVNLNTKKCKIIKPSLAPKLMGLAVTIGDHVYFTGHPRIQLRSDACFERYDTLSQSWKVLQPLSQFSDCGEGQIVGYAVLEDTILFNYYGQKMWAYNVGKNNWYPVDVEDDLCYTIEGVYVVVNEIIYGLTKAYESVMALTLKSEEIEGDLVFTCDLHKEYVVPGMKPGDDFWNSLDQTGHLVHLGKDNFCVVRCYIVKFSLTQSIQLTYIELSEEKLFVTNRCIHEFKFRKSGENLMIERCFSMPKCKTTTVKEGNNREQEAEIMITLPPELLQFLDKFLSQTNIIDEQGGGSVSQTSRNRDDADTITQVQEVQTSTLVEDRSIFVKNLMHDINYVRFFNGLKRFGPIQSLLLHIDHNNATNSFADVEFESVTSKKNAIKASAIHVGDCRAVIEEKRGTGLTQGSTFEDGHSISVTNLPPDANYGQLLRGLKRFGPITNLALNIDSNNPSESFANVEFVSTASKEHAIKVAVVEIGDHLAVIEKKRETSLNQDTTPQVQEDVPKKSSATVVGAKSNIPSKSSTVTGHSICVTNLPPDVNLRKLMKRLIIFGDFTDWYFCFNFNNPSESFAVVEFESVTSKEKAIKASFIKLGGRQAVIEEMREEMRGTGLSPGGDSHIANDSILNSRSKSIRKRLSRMIPF